MMSCIEQDPKYICMYDPSFFFSQQVGSISFIKDLIGSATLIVGMDSICNKNRQLSLRIDESDKSTGENSQNIRERSISEGYGERITAG